MDYVELNIPIEGAEHGEVIIALIADYPFDSFVEEGSTLKAYIPKEALMDCKAEVDRLLVETGVRGATYIEIETRNWNAVWESNFEPVEVEGVCTIRAPFSTPPREGMDIVIMPKMSFGTGHHATTYLMTHEIMKRDFSGRRGLDIGSGTGVLAIAAVKRGAEHVDAVDIDEWAFDNCTENIAENGTRGKITPVLGDISAVSDRSYDFILANINRNILLADMDSYASMLSAGGELIMSGILEGDVRAVSDKAASLGFADIFHNVRDGWAVVACSL